MNDTQKRVLLLSANYEVLNFVSDWRAILMLLRDKVDVLSTWDSKLTTASSHVTIPAVIKLKNPIKRKNGPIRFSRVVVFRRDKWKCQYCSKSLGRRDATIDHVLPRYQGGKSTYKNCVTACRPCNHKKAFKTPSEAGMTLLSNPGQPTLVHLYNIDTMNGWHSEWDTFIGHLR